MTGGQVLVDQALHGCASAGWKQNAHCLALVGTSSIKVGLCLFNRQALSFLVFAGCELGLYFYGTIFHL